MLTEARRLQMLRIPTGKVDMVLDTDTYNEVDDQFALAFLIRSAEQVSLRAVYAAPFHAQPFFPVPLIRWRSESPEDGMERSYEEILHIIALCGGDFPGQVKKGSRRFLPDRHTPVTSPAALDLAERAMRYSPERPLYVAAIAAVTNIASALLLNPEIADRMVVCALIGNAREALATDEFNLMQDVAAVQVLFDSGVPLVQLPCEGVVDRFAITVPELRAHLVGRGPLCTYLLDAATELIEWCSPEGGGSHPIWDVCAAAWPMNQGERFMTGCLVPTPGITADRRYIPRRDALCGADPAGGAVRPPFYCAGRHLNRAGQTYQRGRKGIWTSRSQ